MATCDTVVLDISLWKSPRPENWFPYNNDPQLNVINTNAPHCLWGTLWNQHSQERRLTRTWWPNFKLDRSLLNIASGLILTLGQNGGTNRVIPHKRQAVYFAQIHYYIVRYNSWKVWSIIKFLMVRRNISRYRIWWQIWWDSNDMMANVSCLSSFT